jgi:hypothetical protein
MRDVEADIRIALERGNSPYSVADVFRALGAGKLRLCIGEHMSASCWARDGALELVHLAGNWDAAEVRWFMAEWGKLGCELGLPLKWSGRGGWERFLRMRGIEV